MVEVAIYGAGIAGLTAAHELSNLGHRITVYEALEDGGGFFRSARRSKDKLPTEYSWHGFGPWYINTFDLLRTIPALESDSNLYDTILSRPIDFGIFPDDSCAQFYDQGLRSIPRMFRFNRIETLSWAMLMLKTWCAGKHRQADYAKWPAADAFAQRLGPTAQRTWRSCFGPWIGSDWMRCSLYTCGDFFCKQLTTPAVHHHKGDANGPAWQQGAGDGWLLLNGPSNEVWFKPWIDVLSKRGVQFKWNARLIRFGTASGSISHAELCVKDTSKQTVEADHHIAAINPFIMSEVIAQSPDLREYRNLACFANLVQDGPHNQISFRLAFPHSIAFPRQRTAVVVSDSEFNITLFAQEQAWSDEQHLGKNVHSLWTGTCCVSQMPGRLFGRSIERCSLTQFKEEVWAQISSCSALDEMLRAANGGRGLLDFSRPEIEVWPEWNFSPSGLRQEQPKWVTSTTTAAHRPPARTAITNLYLAGAHTRTEADVWSIEGAVESGRRAARCIDPRVPVLNQKRPVILRLLRRLDDLLYIVHAPHVLWLVIIGFIILTLILSWYLATHL